MQIQCLRAVLLGQLFAICRQHQRRVQVLRRGQTKGALQQDLPRCIASQVFAPHHMGDALRCVIHHYGQLVGPQAVGTLQHEVTDLLRDVLRLHAKAAVSP